MRTRTKYALAGAILTPLAAVFGLSALIITTMILSALVTPTGAAILLFLSISAGLGWFIGRSRGALAEKKAENRYEHMGRRRRYTALPSSPDRPTQHSGQPVPAEPRPEERPRSMQEIADDLFRDEP
ncbi:MAG TPA: hypothetical protein VD978_26340 [Azospirillum sp.]|nr:hypothetical protein [Azospirillum sp.]